MLLLPQLLAGAGCHAAWSPTWPPGGPSPVGIRDQPACSPCSRSPSTHAGSVVPGCLRLHSDDACMDLYDESTHSLSPLSVSASSSSSHTTWVGPSLIYGALAHARIDGWVCHQHAVRSRATTRARARRSVHKNSTIVSRHRFVTPLPRGGLVKDKPTAGQGCHKAGDAASSCVSSPGAAPAEMR